MAYIANNIERRYALKSYHRAADKPDCPNCGHKHRFSEYIDLKTGKPVGPAAANATERTTAAIASRHPTTSSSTRRQGTAT